MFAEPLMNARERANKSRSPARKLLWRKRVWFESTFGLSVMEPWERFMVLTLFFAAWALLTVACYRTLPSTLQFWSERTMFYLHGYGNETDVNARMLTGGQQAFSLASS
ncbi:hypothetical protein RSOLAG1IB_00516 [Rhizoctonia solani AG-1 IB]|uniref:Uncharacterized protein n=1 Tax=Thanatephorus cucumeris (strain AG1-IB / isolate 7/3/14) TaxID=1108050 RepID=M5BMN2_THACB|nr:hypothetical protein BN14_02841 [Rhizoctonia solani AG-1 IB]CEL51979.1 hypothetical protein RSOLAG1IB_00516 [Rhizoctonia solani AG-1 IB]